MLVVAGAVNADGSELSGPFVQTSNTKVCRPLISRGLPTWDIFRSSVHRGRMEP